MLTLIAGGWVRIRALWRRWEPVLFPPHHLYARPMPLWSQVVIFAVLTLAGALAARWVPAEGIVGFDWVLYFSQGRVDLIYPPWGSWVVQALTWELLIGLSVAGVALASLQRAVHPVSAVCALLTLPLFWTLFLGQLEGLITLGLTALPWLTPLALLKPQVSTFAFGARPRYLLAFGVWIALSLVIWGPWPLTTFGFQSYYGEGRLITDVSLRGWGLPLALLLFWVARGDPDLLMLSGAFATLYLLPYNLLPVTPAIARLRPRAAVIASLLTWLPFSANWLGPGGWWLQWLFIGYMWVCLAAARYPHVAPRARWRRFLIGRPAPTPERHPEA